VPQYVGQLESDISKEIVENQHLQHQLPPHIFSGMAPPPPHTMHQQLPLIIPSHPTWPSILTNPTGYQAQPASTPPIPALIKPPQKKTLTDDDRRRICEYHEENLAAKHKDIGGERAFLRWSWISANSFSASNI
jgi:hypothetical protein